MRFNTLIICTNRRLDSGSPSCAARGSEALADALQQQLSAKGLDVTIKRVECLGQCERGPNLRLAPGGPFYHGVTPEEVPDIVTELIEANRPSRGV